MRRGLLIRFIPGSCKRSSGTNKILHQVLTVELDCLHLSLSVDKARVSWKEHVTGQRYLGIFCGCTTSSLLATHKLFLYFVDSDSDICEVRG